MHASKLLGDSLVYICIQQLLSHLRHIAYVRISIRRKGLNSCWGLALYPTLAFTSEQASSTESVDRERGQKLLS